MGSGAWTSASSGSSYSVRHWAAESEDDGDDPFGPGGGLRKGDLRSGSVHRADESRGSPEFLVEADDFDDDDSGESRLVAPPVLGEGPPSYRDF